MYKGKWNDLSHVFETLMDADVVHSGQRTIWTTWKVSMDALDEISRRAIRAVAMLGVGDVPKSLMRCLVNKCVTDGSESNELNALFCKVVKGNLVNGSSLLSEEAERGSFRLHPLIREYVRFDLSLLDRCVYQDIALRAVYDTFRRRKVGVWAVAPHAVTVVQGSG